jgi:hypothetical protein
MVARGTLVPADYRHCHSRAVGLALGAGEDL